VIINFVDGGVIEKATVARDAKNRSVAIAFIVGADRDRIPIEGVVGKACLGSILVGDAEIVAR